MKIFYIDIFKQNWNQEFFPSISGGMCVRIPEFLYAPFRFNIRSVGEIQGKKYENKKNVKFLSDFILFIAFSQGKYTAYHEIEDGRFF